jgi:hypothetical protein
MENLIIDHEPVSSALYSREDRSESRSSDPVEKPIKQYLYFAYRKSLRDAEYYENAASAIRTTTGILSCLKWNGGKKRTRKNYMVCIERTDPTSSER